MMKQTVLQIHYSSIRVGFVEFVSLCLAFSERKRHFGTDFIKGEAADVQYQLPHSSKLNSSLFPMSPPGSKSQSLNKLTALFTPLQLGPITLRNRFFMAALTRDRNVPTNVPTDLVAEHYRQRAEGGAGLIVTETTLISQQGTPWPHTPGIWSEEQISAWKKVTNAVHEEGARIYSQILHVGRINHADAPEQIASGEPVYAPSPIAARARLGFKFRFIPGEPGPSMPTEIQDPRKFIELFRQAAINAKEAGFDGVEVHAGSGFLIDQFLDNTVNKRTDEWGGSVENRTRFGLEILKTVTEVFGPGRVGMKLTPAGGINDVGMSMEDTLETFTYFITQADKLDLSYMMFVRYDEKYFAPFIDGKPRGAPHDVIQTWRPLVRNCKFFVNTSYTPQEAAEEISSGRVDGVFLGRAWIANPDLPKRIRYGIPLNEDIDVGRLYGPRDGRVLSEEELAKGYTDYPVAETSMPLKD
ncbi:hypothetical protein D9758_008381 [Tetrapyrgos nigripes]|uniref:NADH:flavin oxidoreductase/NADH oxidase N-terminal domain-containing protein n=1 Tax=Tetrapyrgos nigripes TaxID=182062 RepID=A0A8H5GE27_9AGAR|nr:hypothetical protein D9758_008381 [Tetrapyrgos nigripes]